jgi:hypothetical protein
MSAEAQQEQDPRTRCGYTPRECLQAFSKSLAESGVVATGRALHFGADLICSGGIEIFLQEIWNYAIYHVGIASPRIFVYLKKRIAELDDLIKAMPDEELWNTDEFQTRVGEIILVVRDAPTRTPIAWPKAGPETHTDAWIHGIAAQPPTEAIRRVWKPDGDMHILRTAGCELLAAIGAGSSEKALFWIRWLLDEEKRVKQETKGATLTTIDRAPPGASKASRHAVGYYVAALFAESYKEHARKSLVRMHEEFQCLLDLYRGADSRVGGTARKYILGLMAVILCEVPRWKVPAAPALIKDPVTVSRAVSQSTKFFREVLANARPAVATLTKYFKARGSLTDKQKEKLRAGAGQHNKIETMDTLMNMYLNGNA